ncbi:UvrD-helicase domain-containing protein [Paenibacillus sp. JJ1722]|uniref:UvrD-helicase domain-containing protein n=1 Tax=Paenibacillus sp. JJ1722 TaxID=3398770 RepID=UPI003AAF59D3
MRYIDKDIWMPTDGLILEPAALDAVKSEQNALVIAGPGAGKTELLAQRASFLLETNSCRGSKKILAISFKRDAAKNLTERVEKRCGAELSRRFKSVTYDAFAKSLVDQFYMAIPEAYRPNDLYEIAVSDRTQNDIRRAYDLAGFEPGGMNSRNINSFLEREIVKYPLPISTEVDLPTQAAWNILLKGEYMESARLSFTMLTRLAVYLLEVNPILRKSLQMTYSHVFLDEFQDTTSLQYHLVKTCFYNSDSVLTAVGDKKQRIMLWAGAMKEVFSTFMSDFHAQMHRLVMNHRSAPRLVEIQKMFFSRLDESAYLIQTNSKWQSTDGQAFIHFFENHVQEARIISDIVRGYISDRSHKPDDICILLKRSVDDYSGEIITALNKLGIQARNEVIYQDFLKEDYIMLCINTLIMAVRRDANAWSYCKKILFDLRMVDDGSEENYKTQQELGKFVNQIKGDIRTLADVNDLMILINKISDFYSIDAIKSYYPQYLRSNYIEVLKNKLVRFLWDEYGASPGSMKVAINNLLGEDTVSIMTIHKSKGLEFKTVIFLGLEDTAFFNFTNQRSEDTSAFFVALTRAKDIVHFTFSSTRPVGRNHQQKRIIIDDFYQALYESGTVELIDHSSIDY